MRKTNDIFLNRSLRNQYEGDAPRVVFVCSVGLLRSPTFADVATSMGLNARACGSDRRALIPLTKNLIDWADDIIFMHRENLEQSRTIAEQDGYLYFDEDTAGLIDIVGIEDSYDKNAPMLKQIARNFISRKFKSYIERTQHDNK